MKLFGGSNKKKKPKEAPPSSQNPPPQQIIKIVGDSKHIIKTTFFQGKPRREVTIVKLTPDEIAEYGVAEERPKKKTPTKKIKKKKPPTSNTTDPPSLKAPPAETAPTPSSPLPAAPTPEESVENLHVGDESLATIEVTRELVKQFIADIWNRGEIGLIPEVCHPSLRFNGHVGMDRVGHDGFARMVTTVREALTDYHCEIHSMVVETNKAFCRLRFTGKHTGNLLGYPPTGKSVAWMGASEFTCKNGKILKVWELGDVKSLEEQLRSME